MRMLARALAVFTVYNDMAWKGTYGNGERKKYRVKSWKKVTKKSQEKSLRPKKKKWASALYSFICTYAN